MKHSTKGRAGLRVVHVINGLTTGGAETVLYRLVTYPSTVEHQVICLGKPAWYSTKLEGRGIQVDHIGWSSLLSSLRGSLQLYRLIRHSRADVVQAWMYRSNLLAGVAGKIAGIPVVWNIRCSLLGRSASSLVIAGLGGLVARWIPSLVINCSAESAELHAKLGYSARKTTILPNGFDANEFFPDDGARASTRNSLRFTPADFVIGSIGRWHADKGFPMLLRALRILRGRGLPVRALLAGRNLDQGNAALAKLIACEGLQDVVSLVGERSDVPEIARALDLHVLASTNEGFPNAVAETMLSGTPNVATAVGEAGAIIGASGWLVEPRDPEAIAAAIEQAYREWSDSSSRWQQRRQQARERISHNFSLGHMVRSYERTWNKVSPRPSCVP